MTPTTTTMTTTSSAAATDKQNKYKRRDWYIQVQVQETWKNECSYGRWIKALWANNESYFNAVQTTQHHTHWCMPVIFFFISFFVPSLFNSKIYRVDIIANNNKHNNNNNSHRWQQRSNKKTFLNWMVFVLVDLWIRDELHVVLATKFFATNYECTKMFVQRTLNYCNNE